MPSMYGHRFQAPSSKRCRPAATNRHSVFLFQPQRIRVESKALRSESSLRRKALALGIGLTMLHIIHVATVGI